MRKLISLGFAYADDTEAALMKEQRDAGIESQYRNASVEENMKKFDLMLLGLHDEPVKVTEEETKGKGKGKGPAQPKKKEAPKKGAQPAAKEEAKGEGEE